MNKDISLLPDYPALKKLAAALWQQDSTFHGAAVMVGSGFSRSASSTGDIIKKPPLWNDLSKVLSEELETDNKDPLRLAEEYRAYFGQQALHELLEKEVNDASWEPSELHKFLLELPWSDVLTTNWDSLLERASDDIHQPVYSVVFKQEDLSNARSPRIAKLHGTLGRSKELVFTQEDYRTYPRKHAAFVNFARQVFIENELCLLGFSGDDPNFINWAGWVRDHLTSHARRIYLVGALGLNVAKRKYLESINITPIDLTDLVKEQDKGDARHLEATRLFIKSLYDLRPKPAGEWELTQMGLEITSRIDNVRKAQEIGLVNNLLEEQLEFLEKDRLSYPGWLVCPNCDRYSLQRKRISSLYTQENLSSMSFEYKNKALYELVWIRTITLEPLEPYLVKELLEICNPERTCVITKRQQLEIALCLLKNTRWMEQSYAKTVFKTTSEILEKGDKFWPESSSQLAYHKALIARDQFNYLELEESIEKITADTPVWKLRKAVLFGELGLFDKVRALVGEAHKKLLMQYRNDKTSIYVLSRLAWAHWLMLTLERPLSNNSFRDFKFNYQETKCEPWTYIDYLKERCSKELDRQQKQKEVEPLFNPGCYRKNADTISYSNKVHPLLLLEELSRTVGVPLRWDNVNLLIEPASQIAQLEEIDNRYRFALAIRSASSETSEILNKVFSRVNIACLPEQDVNYLQEQCKQAINYWLSQLNNVKVFAIGRLRVFIEVLARVSVRSSAENAKQIFRLALSLSKNKEMQHPWLVKVINRLAEFSLASIPESQENEILIDALSFPLPHAYHIKNHIELANPVIKNPGQRGLDLTLEHQIDELIEHLEPFSSQRGPVIKRLLPLIEKGFLKDNELEQIRIKIWGNKPEFNELPELGLLNSVLLELPASDSSAVRALVSRYLFEAEASKLSDINFLRDIAYAAQEGDGRENLLPSHEQAINYFRELIQWRAQTNHVDALGYVSAEQEMTAQLIAQVLSKSIIPSLQTEAFCEDNFNKLCDFYSEVDKPEVLIGLPYFATENEFLIQPAAKLIRQGLLSDDANKLACASSAILTWREQAESSVIDKLILRMVYLIGVDLKAGLPILLRNTHEMYNKKYLSDEHIETVVEVLPALFDASKYENLSPSSRESISISFVRAECIKFAKDIVAAKNYKEDDLNRIIEEAKSDPLPEVRFAIIDDF